MHPTWIYCVWVPDKLDSPLLHFSDGSLFLKESKVYDQVNLMIKSGAQIIDIGGESTRPGSKIISPKIEWDRIKNIIAKVRFVL